MIKNAWYAVALSSDLHRKPLGLTRFERKIVLWRDSRGTAHAMDDRCLHRQTQLSVGRVMGDELECAFHGLRFNGQGQCTRIPANGKCAAIAPSLKVGHYSLRESRGLVWLWWGDAEKKTETLPLFEEFDDRDIPYVDVAIDCPVSFCRLMENNMDFSHFSFVHRSFFTADPKLVLAQDFKTTVTGKKIYMTGLFTEDPPSPKAKKVPVVGTTLFPNMAMYGAPIDRKMSQTVVWVTPIDEKSSWMNVRLFLSPGPFLGIRKWFKEHVVLRTAWLKWVYKEDLRVWTRQVPAENGFTDLLVSSSDGMIVQYLKMYREALRAEAAELALKASSSASVAAPVATRPEPALTH